jgi:dTDP-4-dehydrorhamnose reductase
MKILLTGANGQLGHELQTSCPSSIEIITTDADTLDITQTAQLEAALETWQPDVVINAAAYTAVDKAESDQENAWRINGTAPGLLAAAIARQRKAGQQIRLVHVSTDFIFDGQQSTPYLPEAPAAPLSVYGSSKLAGEQAVLAELPDALITRTSWLYSSHGHNFVKTMLRLMNEKEQLGVVYDQVGTPTWAHTLANNIWGLLAKQAQGIFHCADSGVASWYDFAIAIQAEALQMGLLDRAIPIKPIRSRAYPLPAQRPAFSVMDKQSTEDLLGETSPYWRDSLRSMLTELKSN